METNESSQVARFLLDLTGEFSTWYCVNKVADPVILSSTPNAPASAACA